MTLLWVHAKFSFSNSSSFSCHRDDRRLCEVDEERVLSFSFWVFGLLIRRHCCGFNCSCSVNNILQMRCTSPCLMHSTVLYLSLPTLLCDMWRMLFSETKPPLAHTRQSDSSLKFWIWDNKNKEHDSFDSQSNYIFCFSSIFLLNLQPFIFFLPRCCLASTHWWICSTNKSNLLSVNKGAGLV